MSVIRFFNGTTNALSGRNLLTTRVSKACERQQASLSGKVLKKLGIPQPPKKPLNPYLKFSQNIRSNVVEKHPNLSPSEVIKVIAQEWYKYDPEKKKELQKEYLSEIETYLPNLEKYKSSITPEQKNLIQSTKERKERTKERARINEKTESLGKPKKPVTAFIKFMMERKAKKNDDVKYAEWLKDVAKEWESLPPSNKDTYKEAAKLEMDKYKLDLLEWEQNMIRQGHIDIVRNKDLLENKQSKKNVK